MDLGPAFIKAGQALSTRPDIVPPLLLEELAQLQDQLPGFDSGPGHGVHRRGPRGTGR